VLTLKTFADRLCLYHDGQLFTMTKDPVSDTALEKQLDYLKLAYCKENFRPLAAEGNAKHWTHLDYLQRLIEGEVAQRQDRTILRRIKAARFPVIKTLDNFRWDWPKKINQPQVQDLFRLRFIDQKANVIFLGLCGLGKTHLATALGTPLVSRATVSCLLTLSM
jgi:DNA replication protein DnaC